jgi:hypothetical protein
MREVAPGLYDWTTFHERIGLWVHSHFDAPSGPLIDPRIPEQGVDAVGAIARLLEQEAFDGLLLAHGDPFPTGGRAALERFVAGRGR